VSDEFDVIEDEIFSSCADCGESGAIWTGDEFLCVDCRGAD